MDSNLQDLAGTSTKIFVDLLNKGIGVDLFHPIQWTDETLTRLVSDTLIQGATSAEWWSRQSQDFTRKFSDQMRMGMMRGETLDQLRDRIVPKIDLRSEPDIAKRDIVKTARRNAEALVRTSTLTVMREAHLDVFEANSDIINGVQWVSTLDNRTTPLCRALDGKEWSIPGYEPKGHDMPFPGATPHWNCRSVVIPVTKTWEQLAKEAGGDSDFAKKLDGIPGKERASMGGPVEAGTTYESWFAEQDRERQLEILGPGRMGMYERGTLGFSDMVNMAGKPMTLKELEAKIEDVKYETVTGPFSTFYDPMKAIYDELMAKHGGNLDKVRAEMPKKNYVASSLPQHVKWVLEKTSKGIKEIRAESLFFSADSIAKQFNHHPGMSAEIYSNLFAKIKDCAEFYDEKDFHAALVIENNDYYKIMIKMTKDGSEVYIISLFKLRDNQLTHLRQYGKRI